MGTVSDKLTYLNTTKGKIKDSINLTGAGITDQDTFRSYETKLKDGFVDIINNGVDTLYENFPKVAQTGEEPTLNGVYEAPMRVELNGNTEQDSYSGKNLFNFNNYYTKSGNVTIDSSTTNTLKVSVTTASTWQTAQYIVENLEKNTNYTFWFNFANSNTSSTYAHTFLSIKDGNGTNLFNDTYHTSDTITINTGNYTSLRFAFHITMGGTAVTNTLTITQAQLELGTATTYEPYVGGIASPNPDYPQDIRVVKGDNTINVHGKNLFDEETFITKNNVSCSETGIISSTGISSNIWNYENGNFYVTLPTGNWNFTLFFDIKESNVNSGIRGFDENGNRIVNKMDLSNQDSISIPITLNQTTTLGIMFKLDSGKLKLQIEKGSTATSYQPYQEQTYPVDLDDIELCKIGDYKDEIRKSTGKNLLNVSNSYSVTTSQEVNINLETGTYVVSCTDITTDVTTGTSSLCNFYHSDNTFDQLYFSHTNKVGQITITAPVTKVKIYSSNSFNNSDGKTTTFTNLMIEKGSQATEYEPYGKVWYLKKNIGKVVLDGSENWNYTTGTRARFTLYVSDIMLQEFTTTAPIIAISDYFKATTWRYVYDNLTDNSISVHNENKNIIIRATEFTSAEDFKTWLSTHNTIVYYILATSTTTEITDTTLIEQLEDLKTAKSVEGQTNITQTNEELPFILDVSGLKRD